MNKEFYLYKVISLLIISVFFCSCSKVKNEPVNPAKRNVLDLKNETCKNREKRNVLKISHTRHFKTTKSSPKRAAFIVLNGKQTAFK